MTKPKDIAHAVPLEALVTEDRAAELLTLSPRTLEAMRLRGDGPKFVKLGHRVAYRPSDLAEYVAARIASSTSQVMEGLRR